MSGGVGWSGGDRPGFVWPPSPPDGGVAEPDGALGSRSASEHGSGVGDHFAGGLSSTVGLQSHAGGSVHPSWWRLLERACLGGAMPSLPLGWAAENPGVACWRCGGTVGLGEADTKGCGACRGKSLAWDRAVRLGAYRGGLRAGIIGCKYQADRESGLRLGRLLGDRVVHEFARVGTEADRTLFRDDGSGEGSRGVIRPERIAVVPVPTTLRRRYRNAGVDHALVLARGVACALGGRPSRWLRRKHGPRQAAGSVAARARQVDGMFHARVGVVAAGIEAVVLVDDVRTTGATATACFGALRDLVTGVGRSGCGGRERGVGVGGGSRMRRPVFVLATAGVSDRRRSSAGAETAFLSPESGW